MTIEIIQEENFMNGNPFKRIGIPQKGTLNGTFAEAQEYLGWVLDSNLTKDNIDNFKKSIKVFSEKWNMSGLTTKYLRGLMNANEDNRQHMAHLIKRAGFGVTPTKRYFRELRLIKGNYRCIIYGNRDRLTITEKVEKVGRLANVFVSESLFKILTHEELNEIKKSLNDIKLKRRVLEDTRAYLDAHKNDMVLYGKTFCFVSGNEKRQQKAINKLLIRQRGYEGFNCKDCKHEIKVPHETENDFIWNLYQTIAKDIKEGVYVCLNCREKREKEIIANWNQRMIKDFLTDLFMKSNKGKTFLSLNYKDFCQEFRENKSEVACGLVRDKIKEMLLSLNLEHNIEVISKKEEIMMQIVKD